MKRQFKGIFLYIALGVLAAAAGGCSVTGSSQRTSGNAEANTTKASPDYPPLAAAISQAEIKNLDGSTFKLADKKGKIILLNLWATWCGPCRSEMPELVKMQEAHRERGFEVIGLDVDPEPVEKINEFANSINVNYQLGYADTALQKELLNISQFGGIPQSFLIDRDGRLRGVFRGANPADVRKMGEVVAKLVNEDAPTPADSAPAN